MGMLVFQLTSLAPVADALQEGVYKVPLRASDGEDCLSTISGPRVGCTKPVDKLVSVNLLKIPQILSLDEVGSAFASILADVERVRAGDRANRSSPQNSTPELVASLTLMLYQAQKSGKLKNFWVLQRQLRRVGIDVCMDQSAFVIGFAERISSAKQESIAVNLISRFDVLSDRDGSLINREALQKKCVLIIGLGSIGSVLACELARCGIGRFIVADGQRLEWGNIVRHAAGASDVGRLKTKIVSDLILDRNPNSQVSEISLNLESGSRQAYDRAVTSADVVVCATDSRVSRLMCNRLCIKHRKPMILGGLTPGAYGGMIFQFRSPVTICYHCFISAFPDAAADRAGDESEYAGGPDGHLALDIAPITNLMSKLVLLQLQSQIGAVPAGLGDDLAAPWYIWVNRREEEFAELASLGSPGKGPKVLQWHPVPMEKVEECPHCGTV